MPSADKTKSIKGATDQELDDIIVRLRKENEAQSLIVDLKRRAAPGTSPYGGSSVPYDAPNVSTEAPIADLYHHGILGMKWGIRRGGGASGGGKVLGKTKKEESTSEDFKKARALQSRGTKNLTNAELKALNERLQLEQNYKNLRKVDISAGQKFIQEVAINSGKQLATTYATKYATVGIDALIKAVSKKIG